MECTVFHICWWEETPPTTSVSESRRGLFSNNRQYNMVTTSLFWYVIDKASWKGKEKNIYSIWSHLALPECLFNGVDECERNSLFAKSLQIFNAHLLNLHYLLLFVFVCSSTTSTQFFIIFPSPPIPALPVRLRSFRSYRIRNADEHTSSAPRSERVWSRLPPAVSQFI